MALFNTTLGLLMATINSSIVLISLPAIFRGIHLDLLAPGNVSYLLWMLSSFPLVTAVLVVSLGRLGDIYGRVWIHSLGFVVFTVASVALSVDSPSGGSGAMWLILWRVVPGVGAAMIFANLTAILTHAFPAERRGTALGIDQVAAIAGSFLGLILGGVLSEIDSRLVYLVSIPFGVAGTVWSYASLHEQGRRTAARIDWTGNALSAVGLTSVLAAITYGGLAGWLAGRDRAGVLQFILIIWLRGIWLPLHGSSYESTPLWAGSYLVPLTGRVPRRRAAVRRAVRPARRAGIRHRRPAAHRGQPRPAAAADRLPGLAVRRADRAQRRRLGMFSAPNATAIMNSVPADRRGAAAGIRGTCFNSGSSLSIGLFFSLMIIGLASSLPQTLSAGPANGGPAAAARSIGNSPPVGTLFAAFLGFDPIQTLLGPKLLGSLPTSPC